MFEDMMLPTEIKSPWGKQANRKSVSVFLLPAQVANDFTRVLTMEETLCVTVQVFENVQVIR